MAIPATLSEVPNLTPYVQYVAGSGQTVYPYPFPITQDSDLVVVVNAVTLPTDGGYSLSGVGNDTGGNLTFTVGSTGGDIVTLYRDVPIERITQIGQNSGFSSTAFNAEFNNLYLITQQLEAQFATTLRIPSTNPGGPVTLLQPTAYAGKYLSFDSNGNPQPAALTSSGSITGALIAGLLNLITAIAPTADKVRSASEIAAGVTPVNFAYAVGDIRRYGAVLDGSADDTTAVQHWLSVGGDLTFPVAATAKLTATVNPVSNTRIRAAAGATLTQTTANTNVVTATSLSNVRVEGLTMVAVGSMSSYFNGVGFSATGCTNVHVFGCTVSGHRGWGMQFYNSNECSSISNRFVNSPVNDSDTNATCAGDLAFTGSSSRNVAIGNYCISGNGIGISVHALIAGDHADDNVVVGNVIENCRIYGSEAYNNDPGATVDGNVFSSNAVRNISGAVQHTVFGYEYGNGFYTVDSTNQTVANNRFKNTHSAAVVFVDLLAPGAIGVVNCGQTTVTGNIVDTERMYGITVRDPGAVGPTQQKTVVSNNVVSNITQIGIQILSKANIDVHGNTVDTVTGVGISVALNIGTTKQVNVSVNDNTVKAGSSHGILVNYVTRGSFNNNRVETVALSGISINNSDHFTIVGNEVYSYTTYGVYIDSTCANYTCDSNIADGNGAGQYGLFFGAKGNLSQTNAGFNTTTALYGGTYNPRPASTPGAGTWLQGDTVYFLSPAAAGNIGAVCTTGGTPGTWKTFGVIAA